MSWCHVNRCKPTLADQEFRVDHFFFALLVTYQVHPDHLRPCLSKS